MGKDRNWNHDYYMNAGGLQPERSQLRQHNEGSRKFNRAEKTLQKRFTRRREERPSAGIDLSKS